MEDKLLATLPLSKEALDSTPWKVVALLLRFSAIWRKRSFATRTRQGKAFAERLLSLRQICQLQVKRAHAYLVEAFARPLSEGQPAALFSGSRELRLSMSGTFLALS